ncbi:MAG: SurA N-terminal domain-containing protein [Armatimonadetes bacterium]|nr:SurA N-terminal domain-containing protein [Armatimonadota bacterium]
MSIYKMRTEFGKYLKPILFLIALVFLIGAIWSFGTAPSHRGPEGEHGEGVIAKVNGVEVTRQEFEAAWDQAWERAKSQGIRSPLAYADLRAQEFQRLVDSIALLNVAQKMGVDISDERVEAEINKYVTKELKANREAVLGKLSRKRSAIDPREDAEYRSALAAADSSLAQQEEFARRKYPESQVRAMLAAQGVMRKLVKPVTDADVIASYNVYKIRQIFLPSGKLPPEQLMNKAEKIVTAARSGADFAKLARENAPGQMTTAGEIVNLTFEASFGYPQEILEALSKMKPGEVSSPVETSFGILIVKLESVESKLPAKLDKKAKDERRRQIEQMRQMEASQELQRRISQNQKVQVLDPEILGYWHLLQAQRAMGNQAEYKRLRKAAINAFMRVRAERDNPIVVAKLAQLLFEEGRVDESIRLLYPMLEGENATQEGADLRLLLGDMFIKKGDKERAIAQYKIASEVAMNDPGVHHQLVMKFQQLKRPDLVAAENKWLADFELRRKQFEETQRRAGRRTVPGGGMPPTPVPGE